MLTSSQETFLKSIIRDIEVVKEDEEETINHKSWTILTTIQKRVKEFIIDSNEDEDE